MDNITLKSLESMTPGVKIVGLPVCIDKARSSYQDTDNNWWQDVLLTDATGQMPARILIMSYQPPTEGKEVNRTKGPKPWRKHQRIFVFNGELEMADIRCKDRMRLKILECRDMAVTLTHNQYEEMTREEGQEWLEARKKEIRGKCRYGIVCSMIQSNQLTATLVLSKQDKMRIDEVVKYIMGEEE